MLALGGSMTVRFQTGTVQAASRRLSVCLTQPDTCKSQNQSLTEAKERFENGGEP